MVRSYRKKRNIVESRFPRIKMTIFPISKPDFRKRTEPKDEIILNWLRDWIRNGLDSGLIQENSLLPIKADLAYYFGVGEGTVQTAIRKLEDEGIVVSKQRIGTIIMSSKLDVQSMEKLTSKRDKIVMQLKKYIYENIEINSFLPVMKDMIEMFGAKRNSMRVALDFLEKEGFLEVVYSDDVKLWKSVKGVSKKDIIENVENIETRTLAQKVAAQIEEYIIRNLKIGERLGSIKFWAEYFKISEKTAYDAMQSLLAKGVIKVRRGKYGTIVVKMPNSSSFEPAKETSIFLPADQAALYSYQRIENIIRNKIRTEYSIGGRLPSMKQLSELLDVSTNTIRKAILRLSDEGYLTLERGRFGGIYVTDIPENQSQSFKWLAVNPQYVKAYRN